MSSLTVGFATQMHKRAVGSQGETTPTSKGPDGKHLKPIGPAKEVQISPTVISVDSPDRALGALSAMEGHPGCLPRDLCVAGGWGSNRRASPCKRGYKGGSSYKRSGWPATLGQIA